MQVRIRLQRAGGGAAAQNTYSYRIVAISRAQSRQSKCLDILGQYNPAQEPNILKIDLEKLDKWLGNGAQMSDTVKSLVKKYRKQVA